MIKLIVISSFINETKQATSVVSSEIYGGKFPEFLIFTEISGNLLITYVNQLFPSPALQSDAVK